MAIPTYPNFSIQKEAIEDSEHVERREAAVMTFLEHMKTSDLTSSRDGRDWREFIHEGHGH